MTGYDVFAILVILASAGAGFVRSGQIEHLDENDPELVYVKFLR